MTETGEVEPQTVAMTAPVRTEQPKKATVAMTSPVRTEVKSSFRNMRVSFVMPRKVKRMNCSDADSMHHGFFGDESVGHTDVAF